MSQIHFIHSAIFTRSFLAIEKKAGVEDVLGGIVSEIGDKVKGMDTPEEVLAFLVPGAMWAFGFKKLSIVYQIAEAFGFDMSKFFASIREKLSDLIHDCFNGKKTNPSTIHKVVEESVNSSFGGQVKPEKIEELAQNEQGIIKEQAQIDRMITILAFGGTDKPWLREKIEELFSSGLGNRYRRGLSGTLIKIFSFLLSSIFYSLGFMAVGVAVKHLLHPGPKQENGETKTVSDNESGEQESVENDETKTMQETENAPSKSNDVDLVINPEVNPSYLQTTFNDNNHVWIMHQSISSIHDLLISWAEDIFPQLKGKNFDASSSFKRTLKMFIDRNPNSNLQIMAVPAPFTSIKQIVDSFAADVASK